MKICVSGGREFAGGVNEIIKMLESQGNEIISPEHLEDADALLVCNFLKDCTPGFIDARTFGEMYIAAHFDKTIFTFFPLPDTAFIHDELRRIGVINLSGDLSPLYAKERSSEKSVPVAAADKASETPTPSSIPSTENAMPPMPDVPTQPDTIIASSTPKKNILRPLWDWLKGNN